MATITVNIQVSKARAFDEVQKTTEYIASKAVSAEDLGAYERIAAIDSNREQLDRYWMEACGDVAMLLDHWTVSITSQVLTHHPELDASHDFKVVLAMPTNWPNQYTNTVREKVMSYLVNSIVTKWLLLVAPSQAEAYAALATGASQQITQLMLMRQRPTMRSSGGGGGGTDEEGATWNTSDIWNQSTTWTTT
jgi:hypothetical protein